MHGKSEISGLKQGTSFKESRLGRKIPPKTLEYPPTGT